MVLAPLVRAAVEPVATPPWTAMAEPAANWHRWLPLLERLIAARQLAGGARLTTALSPIRKLGAAFAVEVEGGGDASAAAARLGGLGVGSTPAGDDFLIGAFHALWATGRGERVPPLAAAAAARTTTGSAYWLETAARGLAAPAWRRLLEAMASEEEPGVRTAAWRVAGSGHTSGVASLLGFLALVESRRRAA